MTECIPVTGPCVWTAGTGAGPGGEAFLPSFAPLFRRMPPSSPDPGLSGLALVPSVSRAAGDARTQTHSCLLLLSSAMVMSGVVSPQDIDTALSSCKREGSALSPTWGVSSGVREDVT